MICYDCKGDFEELENWGKYNLCKSCAKKTNDRFQEKKRNNRAGWYRMDMRPARPREHKPTKPTDLIFGYRGANLKDGVCILHNCPSSKEDDFWKSINHESIHFTISNRIRHIGLRASYQYDNVYRTLRYEGYAS